MAHTAESIQVARTGRQHSHCATVACTCPSDHYRRLPCEDDDLTSKHSVTTEIMFDSVLFSCKCELQLQLQLQLQKSELLVGCKRRYSTQLTIRDCKFIGCNQVLVNWADWTTVEDCWITTAPNMRNDTAVRCIVDFAQCFHPESECGVGVP